MTILSRSLTAGARPRGQANAGTSETIYLYDAIGGGLFDEGLTAKNVVTALSQLSGVSELIVRINSPGGDVFDGLGIYNALVRFPATKSVFIDGMAWSIAGVIAMAGDTVTMASNAVFMIHNPAALAFGEAEELRQIADLLDQNKESLIDAYQRHTSAGREKLSDWMNEETWFSAQETVDNGFADTVEQALPVAACWPRQMKFRNMPASVAARAATSKNRPAWDRLAVRLASMTAKERGNRDTTGTTATDGRFRKPNARNYSDGGRPGARIDSGRSGGV